MRRLRTIAVVVVSVCGIGCERAGVSLARAAGEDSVVALARSGHAATREDSALRSRPGYVVDSLRPIEEEMRRFQADLGEPPRTFAHGAPSQDALVKAFVSAIERSDTAALARLVVNRREFGFLVYPTSPNVRPPYRQTPQLVWLQRAAATNKGASRLLERFGGRPLGFVGHACAGTPEYQGDNTIWSSCVVTRARRHDARADTTSLRMFGPIIARGGRYKFLSLANNL